MSHLKLKNNKSCENSPFKRRMEDYYECRLCFPGFVARAGPGWSSSAPPCPRLTAAGTCRWSCSSRPPPAPVWSPSWPPPAGDTCSCSPCCSPSSRGWASRPAPPGGPAPGSGWRDPTSWPLPPPPSPPSLLFSSVPVFKGFFKDLC